MPVPQPLQSRLIGALFVERGLVSESQVRVALEIQRETGQQLGQILVDRFGVSRKELASVVAQQWAKLGGSAGPEDNASWRRLGEIFVERGFVTQEELDGALERQRQTGERLGEALVAQGVISKFELAGALAEQMAALGDTDAKDEPTGEQAEATVHHLPMALEPSEVTYGMELELVEDPALEEVEEVEPTVPVELVAAAEVEPETVEPALEEVEPIAPVEPAVAADVEPETVEPALEEIESIAPVELVAEAAEAPEPMWVETGVEEAEPIAPVELVVEAAEEPEPVWIEPALEEIEPIAPVELVVEAAEEPEPMWVETGVEEAEPIAPVELVVEAAEEPEPVWIEPALEEIESIAPVELVAEAAEAPEPMWVETGVEEAEPIAPVELVAEAAEEPIELVVEPEPDYVVEEPSADPFPEPTELLVLHGQAATNGDGFGEAEDVMAAIACLAFAPTTTGYRLLGLDAVPAPGETVEIPDVGEYLVLRIGSTPVPHDDRVCAFLEECVTPALVEALSF